MINVSRWRCDALVLTSSGIHLVALPGLTEQQIAEQAERYLDALHGFERASMTG